MDTKLFVSEKDKNSLHRHVSDDAVLSLEAIMSLLNNHSLDDAANIVCYLAGTFKFLCDEQGVQGLIDAWEKIVEKNCLHGNIRDNQD